MDRETSFQKGLALADEILADKTPTGGKGCRNCDRPYLGFRQVLLDSGVEGIEDPTNFVVAFAANFQYAILDVLRDHGISWTEATKQTPPCSAFIDSLVSSVGNEVKELEEWFRKERETRTSSFATSFRGKGADVVRQAESFLARYRQTTDKFSRWRDEINKSEKIVSFLDADKLFSEKLTTFLKRLEDVDCEKLATLKYLEESVVEAKREEAEKKAEYLENFRGGLLLDRRPRKPGKKALGITRDINTWQKTADGWYTNKAIADISPPFPGEEYRASGYKGDFLTKALRDGSWKVLPPPVWVVWGQWNLVVFANEKQVVLDAKYYSYFRHKYPGCFFVRSEKYEYAAVQSLDLSVVGVIMPISWSDVRRVKFNDNADSPWVDVQTFWSEIRSKAEGRDKHVRD